MYYELLAPGDTEFAQNVERTFGYKSPRLRNVIRALQAVQNNPDAATLHAILDSIHIWCTEDPQEFANRGGTNGVAYRLWMEAKQALANGYHEAPLQPDPLMPPGCPGTELLGFYVPDGEGHIEICHGFAYRWAIAAGKIGESPNLPARRNATAFNAANSAPVLYPAGFQNYPQARLNGIMQTQPGDIVAMFTAPEDLHEPVQLAHSMIAVTATVWFSANNAGAFGVGTGRSQIDINGHFPNIAGHQVGWVGDNNVWMRPDGAKLMVVYRRIP